MENLLFDLANFKDITILERSDVYRDRFVTECGDTPREKIIYRLIYEDRVFYLQKIVTEVFQKVLLKLMDDRGHIIMKTFDSQPMIPNPNHDPYENFDYQFAKKFKTYLKLFHNSIPRESLDKILQLEEVDVLLSEINIDKPNLELKLRKQLTEYVNYQSHKSFYQPLLLPKLLGNFHFAGNYLQTNIGYPDHSENYLNRMRIMIEQISEHSDYPIPSYFDILRTLLIFVRRKRFKAKNIIIKTKNNHCLIKSEFNSSYSHKFILNNEDLKKFDKKNTKIIEIKNEEISKLHLIYRRLESKGFF